MTDTVSLPVWAAAALAALALWAVLDRLLLPGARWFLRRRVERAIDELNARLQLQIPVLHRTRRRVLIDRLAHDPEVAAAIEREVRDSGVPRAVVQRRVERYAREIVPSFNAWAYFRIGYVLARRFVRTLYRVRLGYADDDALARIAPDASVVFVMNHRSNMDYVIVAYMAANRSALSYAVGEWARIWPLQSLVRALGAFFVRRGSGDPLYRLVLARYVREATHGGVVQAVFPEGGLSRDGRLRPAKLGLLGYMVAAFDPDGPRDLVFVPVGVNYDRVLEDRSLLRSLDPDAPRRGAAYATWRSLAFVGRNLALAIRGRWYRFGYACVNFGTPISMRARVREAGVDLRALSEEARRAFVERLGDELMGAVAEVVPVLPVSLVATALGDAGGRPLDLLELKAASQALIDRLRASGAHVHVPRADRDYAVEVGLRMLTLRRIVREEDGLYRAAPEEREILAFYANAIGHFLNSEGPEEF